jgi:hypothetical protein
MVSSTICHRAAADEYRLPRLTTTNEDEGGTTDKPALLDSASSTSPPPPSDPYSGGIPNNEEPPPSDRTKKFQVVVPRNAKPGSPIRPRRRGFATPRHLPSRKRGRSPKIVFE